MKMSKKLAITMICGAVGLSAALVQAGNVTARGPVSFATYDADGNGAISEQEFNTIREQRQAAVRASGRMGQGMANAPSFADTDTDRDGQISAQEPLMSMKDQPRRPRLILVAEASMTHVSLVMKNLFVEP